MNLSIVDVTPVAPNTSRTEALQMSIELAQRAERLGYHRYWLAEHHGASFIAGRAPEVMIAAVASATSSIRVGSGSVLLNHYSAYKVAEVFCTLNELFPGRIDLGAGRATTGPVSDFALQQDRSKQFQSDSNEQISELVAWLGHSFPDGHPFASIPIQTLETPPALYLLGSSAWSAQAAAALGLRYVFAGFINQKSASAIIDLYRQRFRPTGNVVGSPREDVILSLHVVCADTEEEAALHLAPVELMYQNLARGDLHSPMRSAAEAVQELGRMPTIQKYQPGSKVPPKFVAGNQTSVLSQLRAIADDFLVEELIIQDMILDQERRLRSYELLASLISH